MCTLCRTCEKLILTCTEHTSINHIIASRWNSNICIKTKVVFKFKASQMMCVELRAKRLWNVYILPYMWKLAHPHMYRTHLSHIASQHIFFNIWLEASKQRWCSSLKLYRWCVLKWEPKDYKTCTLCRTCEKLILTRIEHTSTISPVNETLTYH